MRTDVRASPLRKRSLFSNRSFPVSSSISEVSNGVGCCGDMLGNLGYVSFENVQGCWRFIGKT